MGTLLYVLKGEEDPKEGICQVHRCSNLGQPDCDDAITPKSLVGDNNVVTYQHVCMRYWVSYKIIIPASVLRHLYQNMYTLLYFSDTCDIHFIHFRAYSHKNNNDHLVCKAKCGKQNECPSSTTCDFNSDVCIVDYIGIYKKYVHPLFICIVK